MRDHLGMRARTTGGLARAISGLFQTIAPRLAWASLLFSTALFLGGEALLLTAPASSSLGGFRFLQVAPLWSLGFSAVGAVIVLSRGESRIGWLTSAIGLLNNLWTFAFDYAHYATVIRPGSLPAADWMGWLAHWLWLPAFMLLGGFLPLVFPDGRLLSPRWRLAAWFVAGQTSLGVMALALAPDQGSAYPRNPIGVTAAEGFLSSLQQVDGYLAVISLALGATALVLRFRRAKRDQRLQLKWFTTAVAIVASLTAAYILTTPWTPFEASAALYQLALLSLPLAIGAAILKYRLYDIDVVINKTLVFGALAAFITGVYVALVVAVGSLIGTGGAPNLWLSIVATALVAVAFQPVRERVQRLANRIVYGKRATPYEVMADFSHWVAGALSIDEVLPRMAEAAARGVGARHSRVRMFLPAGGERSVTWPADTANDAYDPALSVVHQGEKVGEIAIRKPPGEPLTPTEEKLLSDLAAQAGPVLRNGRLAAELADRLKEIQIQAQALAASRTRIVQAEEAGRRRIERNIHDGVQQEIVALMAKLRLARNQLTRDPNLASATLTELQEDAQQALADLRELARGIHPAVLEDRGLVEAIKARVGRLPIGVRIQADATTRDSRYPPEIEGAAYFLVSEALSNVLKHASAHVVQVHLTSSDGKLHVEVLDDGCGFDPLRVSQSGLRGLKDRIEALGGTLSIVSGPKGTCLGADLGAGAGLRA